MRCKPWGPCPHLEETGEVGVGMELHLPPRMGLCQRVMSVTSLGKKEGQEHGSSRKMSAISSFPKLGGGAPGQPGWLGRV